MALRLCVVLLFGLLGNGAMAWASAAVGAAGNSAGVVRLRTLPEADEKRLAEAIDAYDRGDAAQAEPMLEALARRYPGCYEAAEALGSLYVEAGAVPQALPYLEQASKLAPGEAIAHANLGAAYLKSDKVAAATRELEIAARLEPANGVTESALGQAWMLSGQPAKAAKAFARASAVRPEDWTLRYDLALALFSSGSEAAAKAAAGAKAGAGEAAGSGAKAGAAAKAVVGPERKSAESETRAAEAALAAVPAEAQTDAMRSLAGDIHERLGDYKQALVDFQAAAQANPSDANLFALTAELLRHWTWGEAIEIARFGEQRYPASGHFKLAEGIALYADGQYPRAATAFAALLKVEPESPVYADLLGRSCSLMTDDASVECEGLAAFARAHPGNARAATYAATELLHQPAGRQNVGGQSTGELDLPRQNMAQAEAFLHQAIAADPKLADAYFEQGVLDQMRLSWKESVAVLEQAVALRPTFAEAHYRLSRGYSHLGEKEAAQREIALEQRYAQQEKDSLNTRMQEVVKFVVNPQ